MSSTIDSIDIHCPFDAHLHLRQPGQLLELVVTQITTGGIQSAHVMPNTVPPITRLEIAVSYRQDIRQAKSSGVTGVKTLVESSPTRPNVSNHARFIIRISKR
ncbi:hypothetical protein PGTUg99_006611 [Puccinia graminis f. sp. tritici]|uniref:Uncharacterized protein n=1 Tax=Puccinia graminis f. sp. tritici TaxID=56615 RepID=A0A5B0REQ6_PUCGR|nr:hypothetical protein PGTUg99_006611 [Puccinia graminis f. sp. tritici]